MGRDNKLMVPFVHPVQLIYHWMIINLRNHIFPLAREEWGENKNTKTEDRETQMEGDSGREKSKEK